MTTLVSKKEAPKLPKTNGACADRLSVLKAEKSKLNKRIEELDSEADAIRNHLIKSLREAGETGVIGKTTKVVMLEKEVPTVKDWDAFYNHILETEDFSLLQRRPAASAIKEHWEAGEKVPGVEKFPVTELSVTKA